ncbi:MAG: cysteine desulfurase NifS [archaeon]|nr:cysteine desulfurase NifS [archaeon]
MKEIYADNAATTKMREEVIIEMKKFYSVEYGNPSSFHYRGLEAKRAVENARKKVAEILNCKEDEIVFTGGGTESINFALKGIAFANREKGMHIITSKIEHPAVLNSCKWLEKQGFEVSYIDVDENGIVKLDELKNNIREDTILISMMSANNEIGVIQPIGEIGKIARDKEIYFHTDACQIAGALDIDVSKLRVDLLTLNGSKIYGPKGIGILYIKQGTNIEPLIHGGGQERGLRGGTENVPAIVGFAKALELAQDERLKGNERLIKLRDKLIDSLLKIKDTKLNGHRTNRLPNNVNISFFDIEGESILLHLNEKEIYASTGSACSSHNLEPSHVLLAIGLSHDIAHGSIRFSLGRDIKEEDIEYIIEIMHKIVENLRKISPVKIKGGLK